MTDIIKSLILSLRKNPQVLVNAVTIGAFLLYLCRKDSIELEKAKQSDLVATQRIEHCHSVQEDATKVMDRLNNTLTNHDKAFTHLLFKLDSFIEKMEKTHIKMDALMSKMTLLELHMKEHTKPHEKINEVLEQIIDELESINKKIEGIK